MKIATRSIFAGLVALFIAAPVLATNHWSVYGPWFAGLACQLAQMAAPSQRIVAVGTHIFTPRVTAHVTTACDGFEGIRTFSILFGVVLLLSWRRAARLELLALYILAVAILWCHNLARIVVAVVRGGETHYGSSELIVLVLAGILALAALRARPASPPATAQPRES